MMLELDHVMESAFKLGRGVLSVGIEVGLGLLLCDLAGTPLSGAVSVLVDGVAVVA